MPLKIFASNRSGHAHVLETLLGYLMNPSPLPIAIGNQLGASAHLFPITP